MVLLKLGSNSEVEIMIRRLPFSLSCLPTPAGFALDEIRSGRAWRHPAVMIATEHRLLATRTYVKGHSRAMIEIGYAP